MKKKFKRAERGQSLAEYALILVLVAVVVIGAAFAVGLGIQRIYGLVVGALGGHHDTQTQHVIIIDSAQCISLASSHQTGLWVTGTTNEAITDLTGSTELGFAPVSDNGGGSFVYHPMVNSSVADVNTCPASVVIQAKDGAISLIPLLKVSQ